MRWVNAAIPIAAAVSIIIGFALFGGSGKVILPGDIIMTGWWIGVLAGISPIACGIYIILKGWTTL